MDCACLLLYETYSMQGTKDLSYQQSNLGVGSQAQALVPQPVLLPGLTPVIYLTICPHSHPGAVNCSYIWSLVLFLTLLLSINAPGTPKQQ